MMRYIVYRSAATALCGVEAFARNLAERLGGRAGTAILHWNLAAQWKALGDCDAIVLNFPIVAWKKKLLEPLAVTLLAKLRRKKVTVFLHEWDSLNWKRKLVLWPVARLADALLFSAPEIREEWQGQGPSRGTATPSALIPIPPNLLPAELDRQAAAASAIRRLQRDGRIVVGQFGSIYPRKNCADLLKVARAMRDAGHDVAVVFLGSFIAAMDNVEEDFNRQVAEQGLEGRVLVTGYIATASELFAAFQEIDIFCYRFEEGLTSRRGSVIAAALSGRVVVTNAPRQADSLSHHGLLQTLLANGNIVTCPPEVDIGAMADLVVRATDAPRPAALDFNVEIQALWASIVARLDGVQRN